MRGRLLHPCRYRRPNRRCPATLPGNPPRSRPRVPIRWLGSLSALSGFLLCRTGLLLRCFTARSVRTSRCLPAGLLTVLVPPGRRFLLAGLLTAGLLAASLLAASLLAASFLTARLLATGSLTTRLLAAGLFALTSALILGLLTLWWLLRLGFHFGFRGDSLPPLGVSLLFRLERWRSRSGVGTDDVKLLAHRPKIRRRPIKQHAHGEGDAAERTHERQHIEQHVLSPRVRAVHRPTR